MNKALTTIHYNLGIMIAEYIVKTNIKNLIPLDFMSCLDYLLTYSTGEFLALQLMVLVVFGAAD